MSAKPQWSLVRHDAGRTALIHVGNPAAESTWTQWSWLPAFPTGFFCAAPTILEAINGVLHARGLPMLYVQPDGTIGPADPLVHQIEYAPAPAPFVS